MSQRTAYKLRVVVRGVSPLIWRRLLVPSDTDLDQLHDILQTNFDWSDRYFHCFRIHGVQYREGNAQKLLSDFRLRRRECFLYEYYPLTSWKLDVRLEDILSVDLKCPNPVCVGGQRAGPPEDGLGAWQYLERLDNHKYSFPYEEFGLMARAVKHVLESGTREGLDLDELREAMFRVEDYQQFRPRPLRPARGEPPTSSVGGGRRDGMRFKIQVVVVSEEGEERQREVSSFERGEFNLASFGLTMAESKAILKDIQELVVEEQATTFSVFQRRCPDCGGQRKRRGSHTIPIRTLFGKVRVKSPRIRHCKCRPHKTRTFSPLAQRLPERTTPELLFLETKWSTLISYGMSANLLEDVLPMDQTINAFTIRQHLLKVAERLENSLGEERDSFVEGCDWTGDNCPFQTGH